MCGAESGGREIGGQWCAEEDEEDGEDGRGENCGEEMGEHRWLWFDQLGGFCESSGERTTVLAAALDSLFAL